ncbi:class I SAM-dependent methyltransferase [Prochlorococcus sp. AH-716-D22]|nr:class I SAM-dependent methyltransferase [Prochlorococcus sp. AH-716-D22]
MSNIKSISKIYFDKNAQEYTEDYYLSQIRHPKWQRQKSIEVFIKEYFKPSSCKILNLGCGPGLLEENLSSFGYVGVGIDSSPEMIRLAKDRSFKKNYSKKWEFNIGDCEDTKLGSGEFDCIVASGLIEYMPTDEKLLKEVKRLLKKDGILILNITNFFGWSTCLNRIGHYLKKSQYIVKIANLVKKKLLKEKVTVKKLNFFPRKHIPSLFINRANKNGFSLVSSEYQGFTILPSPLDLIFNVIPGNLNSKLDYLQKTPLKYIGASNLLVLKKNFSDDK